MRAIHINNKVCCKGEYKIIKYKKDLLGNVYTTYESDWKDNLIVDNGLDLLFTENNFDFFCYLGSGTATPLATDIKLQSLVLNQNNDPVFTTRAETSYVITNTAPYTFSKIMRYRFHTPPVELGSYSVNEIGVGADSPNSTNYTDGKALLSRILISFTQAADEYLDIIYRLNFIFTSDYSANLVLNSVNHVVTGRPIGFYYNNSEWYLNYCFFNAINIDYFYTLYSKVYESLGLVNVNTTIPGGGSYSSSATIGTYIMGSFQNSATFTFDVKNANYTTGISLFVAKVINMSFQFSFNPPILKTDKQRLTLTITLTAARG